MNPHATVLIVLSKAPLVLWPDDLRDAANEIFRLEAMVKELQQDKERLDWLGSHECSVGFPLPGDNHWYIFTNDSDSSGDSLRSAIDSAMKENQK